MDTAERVEAIRAFLERNEYEPKVRPNGVVRFQSGQMTLFVQTEAEDETFYRIGLPDFWPLETDEERERAPAVMHRLMANLSAVKLLTVKGDTWCVIEAFHPTVQDLLAGLENDIERIERCVVAFARGIRRGAGEGDDGDREDE